MNQLGSDATLVYLVNLARDYERDLKPDSLEVAAFLAYCAKRRSVELTREQVLTLLEGAEVDG